MKEYDSTVENFNGFDSFILCQKVDQNVKIISSYWNICKMISVEVDFNRQCTLLWQLIEDRITSLYPIYNWAELYPQITAKRGGFYSQNSIKLIKNNNARNSLELIGTKVEDIEIEYLPGEYVAKYFMDKLLNKQPNVIDELRDMLNNLYDKQLAGGYVRPPTKMTSLFDYYKKYYMPYAIRHYNMKFSMKCKRNRCHHL
jgi:hypothetical protein